MVLDEDALEAMLKRQKEQKAQIEEDQKDSKQIELTHRTEEFEVYERPNEQAPVTPEPMAMPEAFQEPSVEEAPEPEPEPIPEPESEPVEETSIPEPVEEIPEPEMEIAPPVVEEEILPVRPRVWPPLTSSRQAEPEVVHAPEPTPEPEPEHIPEPEPVEEISIPEPVMEATEDSDAPSPHAHAHAELDVDGGGVRIAIVQALFNQDITDMMADLAIAKAKKRGAKISHHVTVPGVFDLPLVTARLLERKDVDCAVVLGVVIEGETSHDAVITHSTARTLQQLSLDVDKPIGFGVIGPGMTWKQAEARVANGAHAVDAALAQVEALKFE